MDPILKVQGICKTFQETPALKDVHFSAYGGEIHALMGENGAGKSTLIKVMTGFHRKDKGEIYLSNKLISPTSNYEAQNLGISTVYQEVNLVPNLSVAENIFLGREPKRFGFIDWAKIRTDAKRALLRLDLEIEVDKNLEDYPIAIQQLTAIARAIDMSAKVLILDEATSSLDAGEVKQFFSILRKLKNDGLAIVFVSHFLDQVYEISDRITVLRNGQFVAEEQTEKLSRTDLISKMMGKELQKIDTKSTSSENITNAAPWLKCAGLGKAGTISPFDLELKAGETLGLAGLLGSGRTEIAKLLFGIATASEGTLEIDGKLHRFRSPQDAIRLGFALCPEDRKSQAIFCGLSLRKNIILALQGRLGWFKTVSFKKQNQLANHYISALGIKARDADQNIETMSGGNQQKSILARWLALDPRLLILDEPTRGIDVGAKVEIQNYIFKMLSIKNTIIFISSELEEVVRNCTRLVILRDRKKIGEILNRDISEDNIIKAIGASNSTEAVRK